MMNCIPISFRFVWRQLELAFFGAVTSVAALFDFFTNCKERRNNMTKQKKVFTIILSSILVLLILAFSVFALPEILRCDTCGGSDTLLCRACNGKGIEICNTCDGYGTCWRDDCYNGIRTYNEDCSSCEHGIIINPITWQSFQCGKCDGIGRIIKKETCSSCDGTNKCYKCDGSGLKEDAKTCQDCTGSGRIDCPDCK